MKVLLVGAAGKVASIIRPALEAQHTCYFFDRRPVQAPDGRCFVGDVSDEALVNEAVQGMDSVIYLAMGVREGTSNDVSAIAPSFAVNTRGWYHFAWYGVRAGVRHFIYASSMSVIRLPHARPVTEQREPDDLFCYGMSKQLGEVIGLTIARYCPDATIVLPRMILPLTEQEWQRRHERQESLMSPYSSGPKDTTRFYLAALAFDQPGAYIFNLSGDRDGAAYPNTRAEELLGWSPRGE